MKKLTIGFPTFNRKNAIKKSLEICKESGIFDHPDIEIIVSDNCSPDNSVELIREFKKEFAPNLVVLSGSVNVGATGNYIKLINSSTAKYTCLCSDEDVVDSSFITPILEFLENQKPNFVSTRYDLNGVIYRNQHPKVRVIEGSEYHHSSFYISGLIYKTEEAQRAWSLIEKFQNDVRQFYPLVSLAMVLSMSGRGYYHPAALTFNHTTEPADNSYEFPESRLAQVEFFLQFVSWLDQQSSKDEVTQKYIDQVYFQLGGKAYISMREYVLRSHPKAFKSFLKIATEDMVDLINKGAIKIPSGVLK